jgi:hypothetical protein
MSPYMASIFHEFIISKSIRTIITQSAKITAPLSSASRIPAIPALTTPNTAYGKLPWRTPAAETVSFTGKVGYPFLKLCCYSMFT